MRMLIVIAALLATGCSAQAVPDPVSAETASPAASGAAMARLDGTEWRFVRVEGQSVPPRVTATMRIRGGHVSGKAGCNTYGARYRILADQSASFSQVLSTKMACLEPPGAMQVEHEIFSALPRVSRIEVEDGKLTLLDARGGLVARLRQQSVSQP